MHAGLQGSLEQWLHGHSGISRIEFDLKVPPACGVSNYLDLMVCSYIVMSIASYQVKNPKA